MPSSRSCRRGAAALVLVCATAQAQVPEVSVQRFGAHGNGQADDTAAIRRAIAFAAAHPGRTLLFDAAVGYLATATLQVPASVPVRMEAPILYAGNEGSPALVLGAPSTVSWHVRHKLDVRRTTLTTWQDPKSVGIAIHNANACVIDVVRAEGFTIGVQCIGSGAGFAYSEVHLGLLLNNWVALDLTNAGNGWCNENVFLNGRFTCWSNVYPGRNRYGVRITSQDGTYTSNNNNLFVKPSFELGQSTATPGEAVPVLVEHGYGNAFLSCRDEGNSLTFARISNASSDNELDIGYGLSGQIDDQSSNPTTTLLKRGTRLVERAAGALFLSGPLHVHAVPYDAARVHVPGVHVAVSSSAAVLSAGDQITIGQGFLQLPGYRGLGVLVDTSRVRRFVLRKDVLPGFGGRVYVRCYDAAGNVLQDPTGTSRYVTSSGNSQPYFSSGFGGAYLQGSDSEFDWYFRVDATVASIAVFVAGGTQPCRLRGFSLVSVDGASTAVWSGVEQGVPGAGRALGPPATGTWAQGRVIYNDAPQSGAPIGWVCVQAGTPGTWKSFGTIGS